MPHFLEYVLPSLAKFHDRTLIKLCTDSPKPTWTSVSYQTFLNDVERLGGYWLAPLENAGVKPQDVIGIWLAMLWYLRDTSD